MNKEIWKTARYGDKEFKWLLVSNFGRVKKNGNDNIIKPRKTNASFSCLMVRIKYNNKDYAFSLPYLVYSTFSTNIISNGYRFEYIDKDYTNCSYDNLISPIGEKHISSQGYEMECIGYESFHRVLVQFDDGEKRFTSWTNFVKGCVEHPTCPNRWTKRQFNYLLSNVFKNQYGWEFKVEKYNNLDDIDIIFLYDNSIKKVKYSSIKNGTVEHPFFNKITQKEYEYRMNLVMTNKNGYLYRILSYRGSEDVDVIFEDGNIVRGQTFDRAKRGKIGHPDTSRNGKKMMDYKTQGEHVVYAGYKNGAKTRNLSFDLPYNDFVKMIHDNCFYCGAKESNELITYSGYKFKYNGIDRKNSDKGYTLDNCVPCCHICNRGKSNLNMTEWIDYLNALVFYRNNLKEVAS